MMRIAGRDNGYASVANGTSDQRRGRDASGARIVREGFAMGPWLEASASLALLRGSARP